MELVSLWIGWILQDGKDVEERLVFFLLSDRFQIQMLINPATLLCVCVCVCVCVSVCVCVFVCVCV